MKRAGVHVRGRVARVAADRGLERRLRALALTRSGARRPEQPLRPRMLRRRLDHLTRRRDGVLILSAEIQSCRPVVLRFGTSGKSLDHQVGQRRQALDVARIGEDRGELLGGARLAGHELQCFHRRLHGALRVTGDREHA